MLPFVAMVSCGGSDSSRVHQSDDAGDMPEPADDDAPEPEADAGEPSRDEPDAGPEPEDPEPEVEASDSGSGVSPADAGSVDAGIPPLDAGTFVDAAVAPLVDASILDAGSADAAPALDAGRGAPLETVTEFAIGGSQCGVAFTGQQLWLYPCSGAELFSYDVTGAPLASVPRPGEAANDVDIDVAPVPLLVAGVEVPAGTLLFANGESDVAEIYAIDPATGTVLATLITAFGASHVVGAAYHPALDQYFAIQDRVPGATDGNLAAAIDSQTGMVLASWSVLPNFDVNYGDVDVCLATGNLMFVSSNETTIGEFTTEGTFVTKHALPPGVGALAGIALDDASGQVWVVSNSGGVWRFDGGPCGPAAE